jgi:ABC-2 type transport system permease protein
MRTLLFIIQKEFIQVRRNRVMLPMIFMIPMVQMLILIYAATLEMKRIDMYVVDKDLSVPSKSLCNKFSGSPFFVITGASFSIQEAQEALRRDRADVILHIPRGFGNSLYNNESSDIQVLVNAINGMKAGLINAYVMNIIQDFNRELLQDIPVLSDRASGMNLDIRYRYWFNAELNFKFFMLPGILVVLVTFIGMFLSGLSLVREKELGTIEQINVSPIRKIQFLVGKLILFWIIALFEMAFGLSLGKLLFDIPIRGNLVLLFGFTSVYLLVVMGIGLFFSTLAQTQQQIMFLFFFFVIVFILMSGLFTPTESMPKWAQLVNHINPLAYFMRVIRMIILKGSEFRDVSKEIISLGIYAVVALGLATWRYRKTTG